jgi:hypothetical protein
MLSSGSRDQLCSPPAGSWVFIVLDYWELVYLPHSLILGQGQNLSAGPLLSACCDGSLIIFQFFSVVCILILLTGSGDELVDRCLPYIRQWLITHLLLAILPFQPLFTESSCRDQLIAPPPSLLHFQQLCFSAVCYCSVLCLLFSFCFIVCEESVYPGGYAGLS